MGSILSWRTQHSPEGRAPCTPYLAFGMGMCHRTAHGFEVLRLKQRTAISLFCISGCLCKPEAFWMGLDVGGPRCTRKGPTLSCIYLWKILFYNVSLKYKTYNSACVMKLMTVMRKALLYLPDQPLKAFAKHPFQEIIFKFSFNASPPPASIDFRVDGLELALAARNCPWRKFALLVLSVSLAVSVVR